MIGGDDWAILFGPDLAGPVRFTSPAGLVADARGIFVAAGQVVAAGDFGGGVETVLPVVTLPASWVPDWATPDRDAIEVAGARYMLRACRPDGTGLARLILEGVF